ncbi:MAG TPA: class I SAM-dependent methyltransferase [Polyangiaceae bacterium]|nr:class I SAM-dependent methyltransferase [Polyangiaceae bacterium]
MRTGKLASWLGYFSAFWSGAERYYEYLGDDVIHGQSEGFSDPKKPLWLNLGYWTQARTYPEAARALACQLADAAELGPSDVQLDVGFGFAEQDFLWLEEYGVARITGINITEMQVERARARARERNLEGRLELMVGSATEMPFEAGSFTKVTALECAHHFATRERFFAEAFRVLKPGGRLALADGVPLPGHGAPSLMTRVILRQWASPVENFYDRNVYAQKLRACGFENVRIRSIREQVYPGAVKYSNLRRSGVKMQDALVELTPAEIERNLKLWEPLRITDYLIATADKPAG